MIVDMVKIVQFSLDYIEEGQLLEDHDISALARSAERNLSKEDIEKWLKLLKVRIGAQAYNDMRREFHQINSKQDSAKSKSSSSKGNPKVRFAKARFALDYVRDEGLLTEEVVALFNGHAESLKNKGDLEKWMDFLRAKVGAARNKDMLKAYDEFTKKDCGFECTTPSEIVGMLEKFKSAV